LPVHRFFHARPTDIILEAVNTGEFDYVNLHWYFVNDLNWPAVLAARKHDMGVFIISPNDKGGKLQEPGDKIKTLSAPLTPMQFNDLYCLNRPEVHTLSCGAAKPTDFDEHVAALKFYDKIPETIAPIENGSVPKWKKFLGRTGVRAGRKVCRIITTFPARLMSRKFCACGLTPNRWICWRGARCATTCSARRNTGSPARTRRSCGKLT